MVKKLQDNLAAVAALIGVVGAIGAGFITYGKMQEQINSVAGLDLNPLIKARDAPSKSYCHPANLLAARMTGCTIISTSGCHWPSGPEAGVTGGTAVLGGGRFWGGV